jgi:hypothetical protein
MPRSSRLLLEKELRTQLKRVREERGQQTQRANAATAELETLQRRYERAVDDMARQQQVWEEERKAMNHRVRFPNMSISSLHPGNSTELGRLEEEIKRRRKTSTEQRTSEADPVFACRSVSGKKIQTKPGLPEEVLPEAD